MVIAHAADVWVAMHCVSRQGFAAPAEGENGQSATREVTVSQTRTRFCFTLSLIAMFKIVTEHTMSMLISTLTTIRVRAEAVQGLMGYRPAIDEPEPEPDPDPRIKVVWSRARAGQGQG